MNSEERRKQQIDAMRRARDGGHNVEKLAAAILSGDRYALSRGITLIESSKQTDRDIAEELLTLCLPHSGNARRIGITGVPGVGKSTFIETFGKYLLEQGHQLAVLAIDPSSQRSKGSILGDKTRMNELAGDDRAFIRPSPTRGSLGGVAQFTRESIVLCEAAGFDIVFIETVGVGQSETDVFGMVDFFLLLMLAGAGDELQGIKRGIMEMAHGLLINKADGNNLNKAKQAKISYQNAIHLLPPHDSGWTSQVGITSALEKTGLDEALEMINGYYEYMEEEDRLKHQRLEQDLEWFRKSIENMVHRFLAHSQSGRSLVEEQETLIRAGKITPFAAAEAVVRRFGLSF